MTLRTAPSGTVRPTRTTRPAVGSWAVRDIVDGRPSAWRVAGAGRGGWWCLRTGRALAFTEDRHVRMPNGLMIGSGGDRPEPGDRLIIGLGRIGAPAADQEWEVVRWWDPYPAVRPVTPDGISQQIRAAGWVDGHAAAFVRAVHGGDVPRAVQEAELLLGAGGGLTPEGDDHLIGAVAGYGHLSRCLTGGAVGLDAVRPALLDRAARSTTALSATLLRMAFEGAVAAPVAALLHALAGQGDLRAALATLRAVGGSSGKALTQGTLDGAAVAAGTRR